MRSDSGDSIDENLADQGTAGTDALIDSASSEVQPTQTQNTVDATVKLTPAEAAAKAAALQKKIREQRLLREKEEERLQEKQRIESQKALGEAKRVFEEAERVRIAQQNAWERQERKMAEERQKALLAQEYKERFGVEMKADDSEEAILGGKSAREKCAHYVGLLRQRMKTGDSEEKEMVTRCLATLRTILTNIKQNPTEKKYQLIKRSSKTFKEKIEPVRDAVKLLEVCGFKTTDDGESMAITAIVPDGFVIGECLKFVDFLLSQSS